nr:MAG TPA: hypothetical protein [Caudoviricetes sp.]
MRNYSYHKSHDLNLPTPGRQSPHYPERREKYIAIRTNVWSVKI